ncbi:MAG: hypothetical protein M5U26_07155 [Planctomycetota bacterium]|nr:hypothetical protein [Planctomycetota bacterium]
MKFFFCEKCGKRLTEHDVARGEAKDKRLRGVFCADCAAGVLTMENLPLTEGQARSLLGHETPGSGAHAVRRETPGSSHKMIPPTRRGAGAKGGPARAQASSSVWVGVAAGGVGLLLAAIAGSLLLSSKPNPREAMKAQEKLTAVEPSTATPRTPDAGVHAQASLEPAPGPAVPTAEVSPVATPEPRPEPPSPAEPAPAIEPAAARTEPPPPVQSLTPASPSTAAGRTIYGQDFEGPPPQGKGTVEKNVHGRAGSVLKATRNGPESWHRIYAQLWGLNGTKIVPGCLLRFDYFAAQAAPLRVGVVFDGRVVFDHRQDLEGGRWATATIDLDTCYRGKSQAQYDAGLAISEIWFSMHDGPLPDLWLDNVMIVPRDDPGPEPRSTAAPPQEPAKQPHEEEVFLFEDFENGLNGWKGTPASNAFGRAGIALRAQRNPDSWSPLFAGYLGHGKAKIPRGCTLTFDYYLEREFKLSLALGDSAAIRWQAYPELTPGSWQTLTVDLDACFTGPAEMLEREIPVNRFNLGSSKKTEMPDLLIDNVKIARRKTGGTAQAGPAAHRASSEVEIVFREDFENGGAKWVGEPVQDPPGHPGKTFKAKLNPAGANGWPILIGSIDGKSMLIRDGCLFSFDYCISRSIEGTLHIPLNAEKLLQAKLNLESGGWRTLVVDLDAAYGGNVDELKPGFTIRSFYFGTPNPGIAAELLVDNVTITRGGLTVDLQRSIDAQLALDREATADPAKDGFKLTPAILKALAQHKKAEVAAGTLLLAGGPTAALSGFLSERAFKEGQAAPRVLPRYHATGPLVCEQIRQKLERALEGKSPPETALIVGSILDFAAGQPHPKTKECYAAMFKTCLDRGVVPILVTYPARIGGDEARRKLLEDGNKLLVEAADAAGVPYVDATGLLNPAEGEGQLWSGSAIGAAGFERLNDACARLYGILTRRVLQAPAAPGK